jgi:hypothetical protein
VPLSDEAQALRTRLEAAYDLSEPGAQQVLDAALQAFCTMRQAEALLAADGVVVLDRYGCPKAHPAADIARQSRAQWLGALKTLGLTAWGES